MPYDGVVAENETPDTLTSLAVSLSPARMTTALPPETVLDDLETTTHETANVILRRVLQAQLEMIDAQLTEHHRQRFLPSRSRLPEVLQFLARWPMA